MTSKEILDTLAEREQFIGLLRDGSPSARKAYELICSLILERNKAIDELARALGTITKLNKENYILKETQNDILEKAAREIENAGGDSTEFHARRIRELKEIPE